MSAHSAQWTARHGNRVAVSAFERLAVLHQAITDSRADRDINKKWMPAARAENSFALRSRAHIGLNYRRNDFRQFLLNRTAAPVNRATAGHVAITIHEFGNSSSNAGDFNALFLRPVIKFFSEVERVF